MSQSKTEPTVCCVMLTADRPELARRAVECFRRQTYTPRFMLELDTGKFTLDSHFSDPRDLSPDNDSYGCITVEGCPELAGQTIGELRNKANTLARKHFPDAEILIHWDDDDYSHPNRIAEQVVLLQSSGADCVGYREMLFWRHGEPERYGEISDLEPARLGEVWLYFNRDPRYCLGTSLCYWRKTWERKPFEATSQGDDHLFTLGLKCVSVTSIFDVHNDPYIDVLPNGEADKTPRMIARIHAGNTSNAYDPADMRKASEWKRVPEWDEYCRGVME